jgi:hypothetical protein
MAMVKDRRFVRALALPCALAALALMGIVGAAPASAAAPHWKIITRTAPSYIAPGQKGQVVAQIINLGDANVIATEEDPVNITDALPPGLVATGPMEGYGGKGTNESPVTGSSDSSEMHNCVGGATPSCAFVGTLPPFVAIEVWINVEAKETAPIGEAEESEVKVEGGNAPPVTVRRPLKIKPAPAEVPFGIERYELTPEEEDGSIDRQAGSHPFQLTTTIEFNQRFETRGAQQKAEKPPRVLPSNPDVVRNVSTVLPAGLVSDTRASTFPQCTGAAFATERNGHSNLCSPATAVGVAEVTFKEKNNIPRDTASVPVFNLVPEVGEPARFGFSFEGVPVVLDTSIQTGKGYAAEVTVRDGSQAAEVLTTVVTIWGVPGLAQHHNARGWECFAGGVQVQGVEPVPPCPADPPGTAAPFLTLPTTCGEALESTVQASSWKPGAQLVPEEGFPVSGTTAQQGCERLPFEPSLSAQPDQREASTPTGLSVDVTVPQNTTLSATGLAEADIKDTTLTLPEGMQANAGASDGLAVCGTEAAGFAGKDTDSEGALQNELSAQQFTSSGVTCPAASKIGTVNIKTPLLSNELTGNVYFGSQDTNPFASPLVLYLVAEDPASGVRVKLAGEVKLNPANGQIESVFRDAPPLPFEHLHLHLTNGGRASQANPAYCRTNETNGTFAPSTEREAVHRVSSYTTTPNADGQPCPASGPLPFAPSFVAGSSTSQAGAFSPFTLTIARPDGDAALKTIAMKLPPGLAAVIASVTPCPEPQASQGTCGPESEIGDSTSISGLGGDPISLPGKVYLTGPYNGAPFGLSSVTNVEPKPFHLGTIVVRSSINIDPVTGAATIVTAASQFFPLKPAANEQTSFEGLPALIKGAPAQIKQLNVTIDRPGFQFNPTNCERQEVTGTLTGYEGTSTSVSTPFQATGCAGLPFAPKISATVKGQGSKVNGVDFDVTLESPGLGQANIHKVDLTLPKALPSRLDTIQKACVVQIFEVNPAACDAGSVVGEGIVHTPVFKNPLRGPAYLVSHGGAAFPDVEFVLQGEGVTILLDGKTFIQKGVTFSKFETSPDAPFTKFESKFPEGPHSALGVESLVTGPSRNLCKVPLSIPTELEGQNGALIKETTKVAITGCGAVKGSTTKKLTRAQQLKNALKACKKKSKSKRAACEKQARKKFGPKPAKKSAKKSSKRK